MAHSAFRGIMTSVVRSPLGRLMPGVALIRYRSADHRLITLPVGVADHTGGGLVVTVGRSSHKTWWRHFRSGADVEVFRRGGWMRMHGSLEGGVESDIRHVRLSAPEPAGTR